MNDRAEEKRIYYWSFAVRCFLGLAAWWVSQHTSLLLNEDASFYEEIGRVIATEWREGGSSVTLQMMMEGNQAWGMYLILAIFSFLLGGMEVIPVLIALYSLITAWGPVLTYRIARYLGILSPSALIGARLVMLSPAFALWGGALFKEGLIFVVLNLIVYHVLISQKRLRMKSIMMIGLSLGVLLALRFYLALLLVPAIGLGLFLGKGKLGILQQGFVITILIMGLSFVGMNERIRELLPENSDSFFYQLQMSRDDMANSAASGYLHDTDVSTPSAALQFLPKGVVYFLGVPFPWQFGSLRNNLVIPEVTFWLLLYPFILYGMLRGLRRNFQGSIFLIAMTVVMILFYALMSGNVGTAYRMRSQIWLFWAIFAGWSLEKYYLKKLRRRLLLQKAIAQRNLSLR